MAEATSQTSNYLQVTNLQVMEMRTVKMIHTTAVLVTATFATAASNAAILDNFTSPSFLGVATPTADYVDTLIDGTIPGGERDVVLSLDNVGVATAAILESVPGIFRVGNDGGASSTLTITWDNFTGVDLTASGDSLFQVDFALVQGNADVTLFVNGSSLGTQAISGSNTPDAAVFAYGGLESSTDSLSLVISTTEDSTDYLIDSFQTVIPEPGSAALVGFASLLVASRRRREK